MGRILAFPASLAVCLALASPAAAREERPALHPWGMSLTVGGGVSDFTGDSMRDLTGVAGAWDVRWLMGSRRLVGFELGYHGSLQSIDALGLDGDASLMTRGLDAGVRIQPLPGGAFRPYAFGGAGWKRYDVTDSPTGSSGLVDDDDVLELPLGVGLEWAREGFILDVRGTYRFSAGEDLLPGRMPRRTLDNYGVIGHVGYEF